MKKLWTYNLPPIWFKEAVATASGWMNLKTKEILVSIPGLTHLGGAADILYVRFENRNLNRLDPIVVIVRYNEKVDVVGGISLEISSDGPSGNFWIHAKEQIGVYDVIFDSDNTLTLPVLVPDEVCTLSISGQVIFGEVKDHERSFSSNLVVSSSAGAHAGTIVIN